MPSIGWQNRVLPKKLGSTNTGPLGPSNSGWIPSGANNTLTPNQNPPHHKIPSRSYGSDLHRGIRAAAQSSHCGDTSNPREFCLPAVPGGEEGWGPETSNKLEEPQSICENRAFQNGGAPSAPRPSTVSGLDDEDGPYLQVPIYSSHQHLLSFQWEGKTYMFRCLPFGLSSAPWVFTKLLKPLVGFLRQIGCQLIIDLDDLLMLHQSKEHLHQISQLTCQLFESLGLMVNLNKSILTPTQELEFLGSELCSQTMALSVPSEKLRKIKQDARRLLDQTTVSIREGKQLLP